MFLSELLEKFTRFCFHIVANSSKGFHLNNGSCMAAKNLKFICFIESLDSDILFCVARIFISTK